jgi:hypothetical protein
LLRVLFSQVSPWCRPDAGDAQSGKLEAYITINHVELMNKVITLTGSIVGVAYITELFIAWYSGVEYEQYAFLNRATGPYWWAYWAMMSCNVITPQVFWFRKCAEAFG